MIRLLEFRMGKGLSQRELAKEMCVSQGTYNNWENGRTQPSTEQWIALAHFFGTTVDELVGNTDEYGGIVSQQSLTSEEWEVVRLFRALPEGAKQPFLEFLSKSRR